MKKSFEFVLPRDLCKTQYTIKKKKKEKKNFLFSPSRDGSWLIVADTDLPPKFTLAVTFLPASSWLCHGRTTRGLL